MKIGLSVRIDVTKIDKARLYAGAKGTYLDLTTFVDTDQKDQYENNGFISQSVDKEEREKGVKTPILGNVKVFFSGETERVQQQTNSEWTDEYKANSNKIDEDIPF
jgi:thiamine pyrophosphate-dependent acetolactate synthase large subunit-like protein